MHMLLDFHEPVDALTIHYILVDEVGEELEIELYHLEVDEPSLQQLGVYLFQSLHLFSDTDTKCHY
jgi:hypothetical protein